MSRVQLLPQGIYDRVDINRVHFTGPVAQGGGGIVAGPCPHDQNLVAVPHKPERGIVGTIAAVAAGNRDDQLAVTLP